MPNHVVAIPKWRALSYGGVTEDLEEEGAAMAEIRCATAGEGRFALEAFAAPIPRGIAAVTWVNISGGRLSS
ncbi:MAG: hypothetical protein DUD39_10865 [Coriobacteriaceae bacterium]|jgi:hypothetical protein|uniref:hypothetical protein n=1 Tax=Atopobium sp. oral taxon 416 TaxID=712157 RepID=UPI000FEE9EFF|nr:hypothetical protein [Atopobium sp. oral taxon 416]QUC02814.1 hypothetical protein J4859_12470 [Atopobium sp. oral taxon 416]RRF98197.1 MAG: hypothetical protein DUD39_10865 [Coriobacteriaceae bacterium]